MKIKKIGHCCFVIEHKGQRIMTDPGAWTENPDKEKNINIIIITHEHQDHLHIPHVMEIVRDNPKMKIVANSAVASILEKGGISCEIIENGQASEILGVDIEGFGHEHAEIYDPLFPRVQNTGYLIGKKIYYPGDSFHSPNVNVDILFLPVCGPWMHMKDALQFAIKIEPRVCIPVHDGMLKIIGPFHSVPERVLKNEGIEFISMGAGDEREV